LKSAGYNTWMEFSALFVRPVLAHSCAGDSRRRDNDLRASGATWAMKAIWAAGIADARLSAEGFQPA
jgi:hypothetical protein